MFEMDRGRAAAHGKIRARLYRGGTTDPTSNGLSSPCSRIARQYLDLQKLREEVRQAEICLGIPRAQANGRHAV